jgi:hypothetical protein
VPQLADLCGEEVLDIGNFTLGDVLRQHRYATMIGGIPSFTLLSLHKSPHKVPM